jgi:hypothetical protein
MTDFETILKGGDLRSIGQGNEVVSLVHSQTTFDSLFPLLLNPDRKVVMRAADAIEKITIQHPGYLQTHKHSILQLCDKAQDKELKWHLALLVPRLSLSEEELGKIWQTLSDWAIRKNESKIVRVNALQGLFDLLPQNKELEQDFNLSTSQIEKENVPSLQARIRKLKSGKR